MWPRTSSLFSFFLRVLMICFPVLLIGVSTSRADAINRQVEQEMLWEQIEKNHAEGRHVDVLQDAERLLRLYPATKHRRGALRLRGISEHELGRHPDAIKTLGRFADEAEFLDQAQKARLLKARSQLALKKNSEALLTIKEVQFRSPTKDLTDYIESLAIEAQALSAKKRDKEAESLIVAHSERMKRVPRIWAIATATQLEIKLRTCARAASSTSAMPEDEALQRSDNLGLCTAEAVLIYERLLRVSLTDPSAFRDLDRGHEALTQWLNAAPKVCKRVPDPKPPRSKRETVLYRQELAPQLERVCAKKWSQIIEITKQIEASAEIAQNDRAIRYITRVRATLDR